MSSNPRPSPTVDAAPSQRPVLRVLRDANYRLLWPAGWLWHMGRWVWMLVSGYLVLQLTDSTFLTQMVGVAYFAPMLLGGVLSGVIVDTFERRRILLVGHAGNVLVVLSAVGLVLSGRAAAWHILALTLAFGTFHALDNVARRTFVLDLVGRDLLAYALALESMGMTGAMMVGPLLGGLLLDLIPLEGAAVAAGPYIMIVGLYLAAAAVLFRLRPPPRTPVTVARDSIVSATAEGLRAVAGSRALIGILGACPIIP